MSSQKSHQADRPSATNDQRLPETKVGPVDTGESHRQRLKQRTFLVAKAIRQRMQPGLRVDVVAT
jgi:hypothetical protein